MDIRLLLKVSSINLLIAWKTSSESPAFDLANTLDIDGDSREERLSP
jgi:hypothetical protein